MTYLVLARKWRPRNFDTLVGQEHVVRALSQALSTQRLHHAWLFTGTRGVGKTTLSRILAKALNCQDGITPTPCGHCAACVGIDADRFVDYLELDAASNRGVEEMTKLLEQAVYAPSAGRFKVYMIDEVHMLTGHAFNAMLKTLEEPPPHVKFILATTDPQKIPVTVLSRCLQFNLKQMPPESIAGHLTNVLAAEDVPAEPQALRLIGQAARGSMRDALSLTDQAIAYSGGNVSEDAVRGMLGAIDQRYLVRLLDALAVGDGPAMIAVADELAARSLSYNAALGDLAGLLSQIAMAQRIPGLPTDEAPLATDIRRLAALLPADGVQLFYSIALHSRPELALAPDEHAGFVMACLRMLAFATDPQGGAPRDPEPRARLGQSAAPAGAAGAVPAAATAAPPSVAPAARVAPGPAAAVASAPTDAPSGPLTGPAAARAALAGLRGGARGRGAAGAGGASVAPAAPAPATVAASAPATASAPAAAPAAAAPLAEPAPEPEPARASASAGAPAAAGSVPNPSVAAVSAPAPAATAAPTQVGGVTRAPTPAGGVTRAPAAAAPAAAPAGGRMDPSGAAAQASAPASTAASAPAGGVTSAPVSAAPAAALAGGRMDPSGPPAQTPAPASAAAPGAGSMRPPASGASSEAPPPWDVSDAGTAPAPARSAELAVSRPAATAPVRGTPAGGARPVPRPHTAGPATDADLPFPERSGVAPVAARPPVARAKTAPAFDDPFADVPRQDTAGRSSGGMPAASTGGARLAPAGQAAEARQRAEPARQDAPTPPSAEARPARQSGSPRPVPPRAAADTRPRADAPRQAAPARPSAPPDEPDGPPAWVTEVGDWDDAPTGADMASWEASENPAPPDWADAPPAQSPQAAPAARRRAPARSAADAPIVLTESWPALAARLPLRGMSAELARQAEWTGVEGGTIILTVPAQPMAQGPAVERLRTALIEHFGRPLQLRMQVGETGSDTAHAVAQSEREARQREAVAAIEGDAFVQALVEQFGGHIIPGSIKPT